MLPITQVSYLFLFLEGVASFLSPCILPLLPVYLGYLTGSTVEEIAGNEKLRRTAIFNTLGFVLGISLIFVILGAGAGAVGRFFFTNNDLLRRLGSVVVILFGLHYLGLLNIPFLNLERKGKMQRESRRFRDALILGMVFSFGWTPCIGPLLGSALMIAAGTSSAWRGFLLLGIYSLGLTIPFLLTSLLWGKLLRLWPSFYKHFPKIKIFSGVLLIILGVAMFFDLLVLII